MVDDNELSRDLLTRHARRWGMEATPCASGEEAIRRVQGGAAFDVAVIDLLMPGLPGLDVALELRRFPATVDIPLILLRGGPADEADPRQKSLSWVSTMPKPWKPGTVQRELIRVLDQREVSACIVAPTQLLNPNMAEIAPVEILVVEDNPTNQQVVLMVLRALGYQPDIAENGRTGIDKVSSHRYDIVLLDLQMPDIDGFEVARHIREQLSYQPVIVAITAGASARGPPALSRRGHGRLRAQAVQDFAAQGCGAQVRAALGTAGPLRPLGRGRVTRPQRSGLSTLFTSRRGTLTSPS